MSTVKISEISDAPKEGKGRQIHLRHPYTEIDYILGLFQVEGKYYCITDLCKSCEGSLGKGILRGMFAFSNKEQSECLASNTLLRQLALHSQSNQLSHCL